MLGAQRALRRSQAIPKTHSSSAPTGSAAANRTSPSTFEELVMRDRYVATLSGTSTGPGTYVGAPGMYAYKNDEMHPKLSTSFTQLEPSQNLNSNIF